mmetsp:Transcript_63718/g.146576  ORF Transcript_63718/g.146576 Transcript_63718/m.146576 type:complete len:572 (+) Transcript_63718:46-1761(+)
MVSNFQIKLTNRENPVFWAGETIEGVLTLSAREPVTCRAVRLALQGIGLIHWHTGSGDNRTDYHGKREYVSQCITVFGNFQATQILDSAGENAIYDADSGDGDMYFRLEGSADQLTYAVRVMDYDWGKKDDLLGEAIVNVKDVLNAPAEGITYQLKRNGKEEKGTVSLYAREMQHSGGEKLLLLRVVSALGLRKADWFGKNDVYVQMYAIPSDTNPNQAIPETAKQCTLPAGDLTYPFVYRVPAKQMPSSHEAGHGDRSYVRYSLYANIDIAWWRDPSTRLPLTVMSTELPPPAALQPAMRPAQEPESMYKYSCCWLPFGADGTAQFDAAVDRTYVSPGDVIRVALTAHNLTEHELKFEVKVMTTCRLRSTSGYHRTYTRTEILHKQTIAPKDRLVWPSASPEVIAVPGLPPTFSGNFRGRRAGKDPLTWFHVLVLSLGGTNYFSHELEWKLPLFVGAIPASVVQTIQPTAIAMAKQLEWDEADEPQPPVEFPGAPDGGAIVAEASIGDYIPQQVHDLTKKTVPALQTGAVDQTEHEDDGHCGSQVDYAPQYPAPMEPSPLLGVMPDVEEQ